MKKLIGNTFILLSCFLFTAASAQQGKAKPDTIYAAANAVQKQAEFKGGMKDLYTYIKENLKYPEAAKAANKQGMVFLIFVVEKDGSLSNFRVLRGLGYGCDEEAMRVVKSSPKWTPAIKDGQPVREYFTLPVRFSLK